MKKSLIIFAGFALMTTSFVSADYTDESDIPTWGKSAIDLVQEKKIMTGFGDGRFKPNKNINRAEALVMIFRIKGIDPDSVKLRLTKSSFPDVPSGSWFEKAVIYAAEQGWVKGFPDGKFHPEKELNKAELAIILQRVFKLSPAEDKIPRFTDVISDSWFKEAVLSLYNNDLIRHARALKFFPENNVSRAEAAWIFAEILQKPRLMGTSKENNFKKARKLSSRKVAIRKRNLNVNKQGYDIKKSAIYVNVFDKIDPVSISINSPWVEVGNVILENTANDKVTLDDITFKIRFADSVGPARNFMIKMVDKYNTKTEINFERNGVAHLLDWGQTMKPLEDYSFTVWVKAMDVTGYYPKKGIGTLYLSELSATGIAVSAKGDNNGRSLYKKEPIEYVSRNFRDIDFTPTVE